jgi:hypothetical protein
MTTKHLDHDFSPGEFADWLSIALLELGPGSKPADLAGHVARAAYRSGADRELEKSLAWFTNYYKAEYWVSRDAEKFERCRRLENPVLDDADIFLVTELAKLSNQIRDLKNRIQPILDLHEDKKPQTSVTKSD